MPTGEKKRAYDKARREEPNNREKEKARLRAWREAHPGRATAWSKVHREANLEKVRAYKRAWYAANLEKERARGKARREAHPEREKAIQKAYREANLEKVRARDRAKAKALNKAHPEKGRAYARAYAAAHPEMRRATKNTRRARKLNSPGQHTAAETSALFERQGKRCICGVKLNTKNRHLDHIRALSRGGSNDISNLQWLCAPCNLSKHAKDPIEWAQENGRLL